MRISLFTICLFLFACKSTQKVPAIPPVITPTGPLKSANISNDIPKNIILMIGDGMGLSQITAGMYANNNHTALEDFPVVGLHKCHASNNLITDSAAAATAFSIGKKTYNGAIGVDSDSIPVKTILEELEEKDYATGLIATSTIVHATPASFIAHNVYRKNYEEIALDFLETEVDFFAGGGKKYFDRRKDDRNLIEELSQMDYTVYDHLTDFEDCTIPTSGNFAYLSADKDPLPYDQGRDYLIPASKAGVHFLNDHSEKGFFLMIEGSQIDWGGHANNADYVINEFLEYNEIIAWVLNWAKKDGETLVVVTADHETGGLAINEKSTMEELDIAFTTAKHTADMIPVFAYGPGSERFAGIYENTEIYHKMKDALHISNHETID